MADINNLVPGKKFGSTKEWKFANRDYCKLFKVCATTLRRWEKAGVLDRSDLESIVSLYLRRGK